MNYFDISQNCFEKQQIGIENVFYFAQNVVNINHMILLGTEVVHTLLISCVAAKRAVHFGNGRKVPLPLFCLC